MSDRPAVNVILVDGPLEPARYPRSHGGGAVLTFEGVVRGDESGQPIAGLDYQQYPPMTERELAQLGEAVGAEHGLLALTCEHSLGLVRVGEVSFRLTVVGGHRKETLAATEAFIDRMKAGVPLWKNVVWA